MDAESCVDERERTMLGGGLKIEGGLDRWKSGRVEDTWWMDEGGRSRRGEC